MNELSVSESSADAGANEVIRVTPATCDFEHLSLVRFGDEFESV